MSQPINPVQMQPDPNRPMSLVQPVPVALAVGEAQTPQGRMTVFQVNTPVGTFAFMVPPEVAEAFGKQLQEAGAAQKGPQLVVPRAPMPSLQDIIHSVDSKQ